MPPFVGPGDARVLNAVPGEDHATAVVHADRDADDRRALGIAEALCDVVGDPRDRNRLVELRDRHAVQRRVPLELGMGKRFRQARHGRRSVPGSPTRPSLDSQPVSERDPTDAAWYDEELARVTIGEVKPLEGPIELVEYDPRWPLLYAHEEDRIRGALGTDVVRIEHAGSTSVPGLPAKPVIDILLEVPDSAAEEAYVPALEAAGDVLRIREPEWFEHRLFKGPDTNVNLHVFGTGCEEVRKMLAFRDRLRESEADRELYASAKRDLAAREWKHVQQYADAKTAVVHEILARAETS